MSRTSDERHGTTRRSAVLTRGVVAALTLTVALVPFSIAPASAATCPSPAGATIPNAPTPAGAELVVRGHGWGHSTGMSQYGAQGAARLGCTSTQILAAYYPGTKVVRKTLVSAVDVTLMTGGSRAAVTAVSAAMPWAGPSGKSATQPKGSTWSVVMVGTAAFLRNASGANVFSVTSGQTLRGLENARVARVRSYKGATLVTDRQVRWDETWFVPSSTGLSATQAIRQTPAGTAVQKYLWGLAEVPSSWPTHALRAQAIAARTYLVKRFNSARGAYVVSATPSDQNYGGYTTEAADAANGGHWKAAVDATPGDVVVTSAGAVIDALYSSSHGGRSEDVRYSFGGAAISYLTSVNDSRWDLASDNPYRSWAVGFTAASVASRFGLDSVASVTVGAPGTTARLAGVKVAGRKGGVAVTKTYTGMQARALLGVRSPGVTFAWVKPPVVDNGQAISGDWDGNGRTDVGWFKDGMFSLRWPDGTKRRIALGAAGDIAVVADWNGDGRDGIGVFHDGTWSVRNTLTGASDVRTFTYGRAGDIPVAGPWTTASPAGIGVVRAGRWLMRSLASQGSVTLAVTFSGSGTPVLGDWDANGRVTPGWMKNGAWSLSNAIATPKVQISLTSGRAGDDAVVGDWNGDRRETPGVARSSSFFWRDDLKSGAPTGKLGYAP